MNQKINREELINFIKSKDKFYEAVNFSGHTIEQLFTIKIRIENEEKCVLKTDVQK